MKTRKVYINEQDEGFVQCPQCGSIREIRNVSKITDFGKVSRAECRCGFTFKIVFERRKFYRMIVSIPGTCYKPSQSMEKKRIVIEDISLAGLRFRASDLQDIKINDILTIEYFPEDEGETLIRKEVIVRNINNLSVGAAFYDKKENKRI